MPQSPSPDYVAGILSAATAGPVKIAAADAVSQTDDVTELQRDNKRLQTDIHAAEKRAAKRYKDMMHANRRAERAEAALKNQVTEREGDKMEAYKLFSHYKTTIKSLEETVAQTAQAALETASAQQKEATSQVQAHAQKMIQDLQAKAEGQRAQDQNEARQLCDKKIAEMKEQMSKQFQSKVEAIVSQLQVAQKSLENENKDLKDRLNKSEKLVEWHKAQAQQQAAQRGGTQNVPVMAGIHAGFPLPPQQSAKQASEAPNKRRRLDSRG